MRDHQWRERPYVVVDRIVEGPDGNWRRVQVGVDRWRSCVRCGVSDGAARTFGWSQCNGGPDGE